MKKQNTFVFIVLALCWGTFLTPTAMAKSASVVENLTGKERCERVGWT